jgi:flavin reductase (DIM6/NTAB) family NADH-FMN oxidoreductase RutF
MSAPSAPPADTRPDPDPPAGPDPDPRAGPDPEPGPDARWVSVPPNAFYIPSPVVLLSTEDEDGTVDVSAMSAVGVTCLDPPIVAVGIKPRRHTYRNIRRTGRFVVNLPAEDDLWAVDYTGTRKLRAEPDKLARSGLATGRLPGTGLPFVTSCPIAMACRLVGNIGRAELGLSVTPSHQTVLGRIEECLVDARWLGEDEVRLEEIPVLLYLNRVYARRGERLAVQRFTDDPARREQKMREYRALNRGPGTD